MIKIIPQKLLIIGCGGHAKVITEIAKLIGIKVFYYQDSNLEKNKFLGNNVIHDDIKNYNDNFFVAIGDNFIREEVTRNFKKKNPNAINTTLIHPTSTISESCSIGDGTVVMPLCVINSFSKIGKGVIVNSRSSLDHENLLMDFCSIAPGVVTGGNVKIGFRTSISIGTIIKNDIEIGSDTVIGAASYVNKNIQSESIAYGTPAKIVKKRKANDKYL